MCMYALVSELSYIYGLVALLDSIINLVEVKVCVSIVGTSHERRSEKNGEQSAKSNRAVMV
jgi:hypothetical protein